MTCFGTIVRTASVSFSAFGRRYKLFLEMFGGGKELCSVTSRQSEGFANTAKNEVSVHCATWQTDMDLEVSRLLLYRLQTTTALCVHKNQLHNLL